MKLIKKYLKPSGKIQYTPPQGFVLPYLILKKEQEGIDKTASHFPLVIKKPVVIYNEKLPAKDSYAYGNHIMMGTNQGLTMKRYPFLFTPELLGSHEAAHTYDEAMDYPSKNTDTTGFSKLEYNNSNKANSFINLAVSAFHDLSNSDIWADSISKEVYPELYNRYDWVQSHKKVNSK